MIAVGQSRLLQFTVYDANGALDGLAAVTLTVIDPNGSVTTPTPSTSSTGLYEYLLDFTLPGFWQWNWAVSGSGSAPRVQSDAEFAGPSASSQYPVHAWCTNEDAASTPALRKIATSIDQELLARACMAATEYLHSRTWRRFVGFRTVELRPCFGADWASLGFAWWLTWPFWQMGGGWGAQPWGGDPIPTLEGPAEPLGRAVPQIVLPGDVQQVTRVLIDGVALASTAWRLDSGRRLVRLDGSWWPTAQDLLKASTQADTFAVEVIVGERENELARLACMELTAELYLGIADPSSCRIPVKVTQVTRQGATYQMQELQSMVDQNDVVKLPVCQVFLSQFGKRRRRIRVYNVDIPEATRRL